VITRIISGGQTGIDRAALEWALAHGYDIGGYAPKGFRAEDGRIPGHLAVHMTEMSSGDYPARTRKNVEAADTTLVVVPYPEYVSAGTSYTKRILERRGAGRPWCFAWGGPTVEQEAGIIGEWLRQNAWRFSVLNVAGPRLSKWPEGPGVLDALLSVALPDRRAGRVAP
jgi:hypothetical protein